MIDIDRSMKMYNDNRNWYVTTIGEEKELINILYAEVERLRKDIEVLSKYRDIVEKYDDALLADGDTDPRWSEIYD